MFLFLSFHHPDLFPGQAVEAVNELVDLIFQAACVLAVLFQSDDPVHQDK